METKFRQFFLSLPGDEQEKYARRAGTTAYYIRVHLICKPPRRISRPPLLKGLAEASNGQLSFNDMIEHFYQRSKENTAA